jgi:peroxiredoxin Q/BCP
MPNIGESAPNPVVQGADGANVALFDAAALPMVLYFYPKDDTSGCTREAQDFTALAADFAKIGVAVVGVSKDTPKKHAAFIAKYGLEVALVSDADEEKGACVAYGAWVEKSMYGKKYMGIERCTFLIGKDGKIAQLWRKVKVPGHAQEVLEAARAL